MRPDLFAAPALWAVLVPQSLAYGQLSGRRVQSVLRVAAMTAYRGRGQRYLNVGPESSVRCGRRGVGSLLPGDPERYAALAAAPAIRVGFCCCRWGSERRGPPTAIGAGAYRLPRRFSGRHHHQPVTRSPAIPRTSSSRPSWRLVRNLDQPLRRCAGRGHGAVGILPSRSPAGAGAAVPCPSRRCWGSSRWSECRRRRGPVQRDCRSGYLTCR